MCWLACLPGKSVDRGLRLGLLGFFLHGGRHGGGRLGLLVLVAQEEDQRQRGDEEDRDVEEDVGVGEERRLAVYDPVDDGERALAPRGAAVVPQASAEHAQALDRRLAEVRHLLDQDRPVQADAPGQHGRYERYAYAAAELAGE